MFRLVFFFSFFSSSQVGAEGAFPVDFDSIFHTGVVCVQEDERKFFNRKKEWLPRFMVLMGNAVMIYDKPFTLDAQAHPITMYDLRGVLWHVFVFYLGVR